METMKYAEPQAPSRSKPPDGHASLIRPRLTELVWNEPVLLIEAPTGYGKSTLARQLLEAVPDNTRTVEIALHAEHRNPGVLLAEMLHALPPDSAPGIDPASEPPDLFQQLVAKLENDKRPHCLFLDDIQKLAGSAAMTFLNRLLHGSGPDLRFILAAREFRDPALAIAELSARGLVHWLDAADLAMTKEEARQLAQSRTLLWTPDQVDALVRVTQGWPVLLQLALSGSPAGLDDDRLSMADSAPVRRYIEDRFLSQLTSSESSALINLACDESVPLAMLDALEIDVKADALARLEQLGIVRRVNLITGIEALSLHPMLREIVLRAASPTAMRTLNHLRREGANWWREQKNDRRAVQLLLEAGEQDLATQWLLQAAEEMIFRTGHHQTFLDLLDSCAPSPGERTDSLEQLAVWALIFLRRHAEAERRLRSVHTASEDTQGTVILQRATIAALCDDHRSAAAFADDWLKGYTGQNFYQGVARVIKAFDQKCESHFEEATENLSQARRLFSEAESQYGLAWTNVVSLLTLLKAGRHRQARVEIDTGLKAMANSEAPSSQRSMLLGIRALLNYERNDLAAARADLEACLPLIPDQGIVDAMVCAYISAARLRYAEGDLGTALDLLAEGEHIGEQRGLPRLSKAIAAEKVMCLLRAGAVDQAESTARMAGLRPDSDAPFEQDRGARLFARIALLRGEAGLVNELMQPMIAHARETGQQFKVCECLLLSALADDAIGNQEGALEQLHESFRLGEIEAYFRVYFDELMLLSPLIERYESRFRGRSSPIARKLLRAATAGAAASNTLEALSDRETQILRLLAQGLSNADIAARCFLGAGTVKWHLHNIYGKLDVGSRTAAVHAAQKIGIL